MRNILKVNQFMFKIRSKVIPDYLTNKIIQVGDRQKVCVKKC